MSFASFLTAVDTVSSKAPFPSCDTPTLSLCIGPLLVPTLLPAARSLGAGVPLRSWCCYKGKFIFQGRAANGGQYQPSNCYDSGCFRSRRNLRSCQVPQGDLCYSFALWSNRTAIPRSHGDCRTEAESLCSDPQTQGSAYCPCVGGRGKWNILTKAKHGIFFYLISE